MNRLRVRREARRAARAVEIGDLERATGLPPTITEDDTYGLPHVRVVRNPAGSWTLGDRWVAEGFGDYDQTYASTRRGCVRRARRRLRAMVYNRLAGPVEVRP